MTSAGRLEQNVKVSNPAQPGTLLPAPCAQLTAGPSAPASPPRHPETRDNGPSGPAAATVRGNRDATRSRGRGTQGAAHPGRRRPGGRPRTAVPALASRPAGSPDPACPRGGRSEPHEACAPPGGHRGGFGPVAKRLRCPRPTAVGGGAGRRAGGGAGVQGGKGERPWEWGRW